MKEYQDKVVESREKFQKDLIEKFRKLKINLEKWKKLNLKEWDDWFYLLTEFGLVEDVYIWFKKFKKEILDKNRSFKVFEEQMVYRCLINIYILFSLYGSTYKKELEYCEEKLLILFNSKKENRQIEMFPYNFLLLDKIYLKKIADLTQKYMSKLLKLPESDREKYKIWYIRYKLINYLSLYFIDKDKFLGLLDEIKFFINKLNNNTNLEEYWWTILFLKDVLSYLIFLDFWWIPDYDRIQKEIVEVLEDANLSFEKVLFVRWENFENKLYFYDLLILKLRYLEEYRDEINEREINEILFRLNQILEWVFGENKYKNVYFDKLCRIYKDCKLLKRNLDILQQKEINEVLLRLMLANDFEKLTNVLVKLFWFVRIAIYDENNNLIFSKNGINYGKSLWDEIASFWDWKEEFLSILSMEWTSLDLYGSLTLIWKIFVDSYGKKYKILIDRWSESVRWFSDIDLKLISKILEGLVNNEKSKEDENYKRWFTEIILNYIWKLNNDRDPETAEHMERVWKLAKFLLENDVVEKQVLNTMQADIVYVMKRLVENFSVNNKEFLEILEEVAKWHDIWKILIPDKILRKPWRFTDDEYEAMKYHTILWSSFLLNRLYIVVPEDILILLVLVSLTHHLVIKNYPFDVGSWEINLKEDIINRFDLNFDLINDFINSQFLEKFLELYKKDGRFRRWVLFLSFVVGFADAFDAMKSKRGYKLEFDIDKIKKFLRGDIESFINRIKKIEDKELLKVFENIKEKLNLLIDLLNDLFVNNAKNEWVKGTNN